MAARKKKKLNKSFFYLALISTILLFIVLGAAQIYFLFFSASSPPPLHTGTNIGQAISPIMLPKTKLNNILPTVQFDKKLNLNLTQLSKILAQAPGRDINIYISADHADALNPGLYRYSSHQLALIQPGKFNQKLFQSFKRLSLRDASVILIITASKPVSSVTHFQSGQTTAKIIQQANSLSLGYNLISITDFETINTIFSSLNEHILYLISLGYPILE